MKFKDFLAAVVWGIFLGATFALAMSADDPFYPAPVEVVQ